MNTCTFKYTKKNGETSTRTIVVVHDTTDKVTGFDLAKLSPEEQKKVLSAFGNKVPTNVIPPKTGTFDYAASGVEKEIWTKSYRLFDKANIRSFILQLVDW